MLVQSVVKSGGKVEVPALQITIRLYECPLHLFLGGSLLLDLLGHLQDVRSRHLLVFYVLHHLGEHDCEKETEVLVVAIWGREGLVHLEKLFDEVEAEVVGGGGDAAAEAREEESEFLRVGDYVEASEVEHELQVGLVLWCLDQYLAQLGDYLDQPGHPLSPTEVLYLVHL